MLRGDYALQVYVMVLMVVVGIDDFGHILTMLCGDVTDDVTMVGIACRHRTADDATWHHEEILRGTLQFGILAPLQHLVKVITDRCVPVPVSCVVLNERVYLVSF